jgi:hypothetical protein
MVKLPNVPRGEHRPRERNRRCAKLGIDTGKCWMAVKPFGFMPPTRVRGPAIASIDPFLSWKKQTGFEPRLPSSPVT